MYTVIVATIRLFSYFQYISMAASANSTIHQLHMATVSAASPWIMI